MNIYYDYDLSYFTFNIHVYYFSRHTDIHEDQKRLQTLNNLIYTSRVRLPPRMLILIFSDVILNYLQVRKPLIFESHVP